MFEDGFGLFAGDDRFKRGGVGFADCFERTEVLKQAFAGKFAHAGDVEQFAVTVAHLPALAMECHSEAVCFIAHLLDEVQSR